MSFAAKDYFVTVGDENLRVGRVTASKPGGLEDVEVAVYCHQKCHDEILKILLPVDNEPTFGSPRCNVHLHIDVENAKITVEIIGDRTGKDFNYGIKIENP